MLVAIWSKDIGLTPCVASTKVNEANTESSTIIYVYQAQLPAVKTGPTSEKATLIFFVKHPHPADRHSLSLSLSLFFSFSLSLLFALSITIYLCFTLSLSLTRSHSLSLSRYSLSLSSSISPALECEQLQMRVFAV